MNLETLQKTDKRFHSSKTISDEIFCKLLKLHNGNILAVREVDNHVDGVQIWTQYGERVSSMTWDTRNAIELDDGRIVTHRFSSGAVIIWDANLTQPRKLSDEVNIGGGIVQRVIKLQNGNIALKTEWGWTSVVDVSGETCELVRRIEEPSDMTVYFVEVKDNIIARGDYCEDRIWDLTTGECLHIFDTSQCGAFRLRNDTFVIAESYGDLILWNSNTMRIMGKFIGHGEEKEYICNPCEVIETINGSIISCHRDQTLRFWSKNTFECLHVEDQYVISMVGMRNGNMLTMDRFGNIQIWDTNTPTCIYKTHVTHDEFEWNGYRNARVVELDNGNIFIVALDGLIHILDRKSIDNCIDHNRIWKRQDVKQEHNAADELMDKSNLRHTPWRIIVKKLINPWSVYYTRLSSENSF